MQWWRIGKRHADLERELRADLELEEEEQREKGVPQEDAPYSARRAFGNKTLIREQTHEAWGWAPFERLLADVRYALRVLLKSPGFALTASLTLALGIGANAAIFSLVSAIILRPLPYPSPKELVGLGQWRNQKGEGYVQTGVSAPNIIDIAAQRNIFQQVGYYRFSGFNITEGSHPESVDGIKASLDMLPLFGVQPLTGRFFTAEEVQPGHDQVAILGHRLWQTRYGSDPSILGKTIRLDEKPYTIIGIMPARFRFTWDQEMGVFVPLALTPEELSEKGRATSRDLETQARLQQNVTVKQAQAAMDTLAASLAAEHPVANKGWGFKVEPLHAAYYRHIGQPLLIMSGAVLFVLLIACGNVANLLLARATVRRREIAIRAAIGATRRRLITQLLTESVVLAAIGGGLGLLLAYVGDRILTLQMTHYRRYSVPNASVINLDWRVVLFALALTMLTGIIFGLAPAWIASRTDLNESLRESGANSAAESGRQRLRNGLVVSEIALALVLLTGAGLLVRTFMGLMKVDLGIDPTNVVTMEIDLPHYKYPEVVNQTHFYRQLLQRVQNLPGVKAAGIEQPGARVFFQPEGQPVMIPGQEPTAELNVVSPDNFAAMGIGLVTGRGFTQNDVDGATPVALISETAAHRYWPNANPIGRHLAVLARVYSGQSAEAAQPLEIVGIVKDVRGYDLWEPRADIYVPFEQHPMAWGYLSVRTAVPPMTVPSIRDAVLAIDSEQPVNDVMLLSDQIAQSYGTLRFPMTLVWIFASLALALSAVGIFGVMSYTVSRRTHELAIRMALGADRAMVLRQILREGLGVTLIGVVIGLAAALALSRIMGDYVYGIKATDPLTYSAATLVLVMAAMAACYIPARRAASVDPMRALRNE
ncbi:MAG TPA: ABC transporter permease [Terracidiphilus sp.]|jgi:putative ABC transport system permease protein